MAELIRTEPVASPLPGIPARAQILAVVWLRWRIFVNNTFRRRPSNARQAAGLVGAILLRIIVWPFMAAMAVGPVAGSGFLGWAAISQDRPQTLLPLLAGITLLWQFISINGLSIAASLSSFDPSSLTRFPLRFGRYLFLRTLLGLLTPSTIVGCLALLAAAVGIGIASPVLALPAFVVLATYAVMNIFLTRMIGAWMERWLANRRFREIFGMLMALFAVGVQYLNFQRAPMRADGATHSSLHRLLTGSDPYLNWLPPGFAAHSILGWSHPLTALYQFVALLASTALFAGVFAIRLHKQFLGELITESAPRRAQPVAVSRLKTPAQPPLAASTHSEPRTGRYVFPPIVAACFRKELLTLRGNGTQLIGMLTPLIFVVLLSRTMFTHDSAYFLPGVIAYVLIGLVTSLYNIFGADGLGVQVYLLAPIRLRDVILAKNLMSLSLVVTEAILAWIVVTMVVRTPILLSTQVSTALWTIFVIAANLAVGTIRSIQAPRKFVPGQMRQRRGIPTNRTSSLLMLLVLFGSLALQVPVTLLSHFLHEPWLGACIMAPFAGAAVLAYALLLRNAERLIMAHRDVFSEELCKV